MSTLKQSENQSYPEQGSWYYNDCEFNVPEQWVAEEKALMKDKPKRPGSAYVCYLVENRPVISLEQPHLSTPQCTTLIAKQWKALAPNERAVYERSAAFNQSIHRIKMERWNHRLDVLETTKVALQELAKYEWIERLSLHRRYGHELVLADCDPQQQQLMTTTKPHSSKPRRAKSSFLYFCAAKRISLKETNTCAPSRVIATMLGDEWLTMTDAQKAPYVELATADMDRYTREMQAWNDKQTNEAALAKQASDAAYIQRVARAMALHHNLHPPVSFVRPAVAEISMVGHRVDIRRPTTSHDVQEPIL